MDINQHFGYVSVKTSNCGSWGEGEDVAQGLSWAGLESNTPLGFWLGNWYFFLLPPSLLQPWQSKELMIPLVGCDCYRFSAAQNVFLPPLLTIHHAPPPCPWWETSFLWSHLHRLLAQERTAEMKKERRSRKEVGETRTSLVAPKIGLQTPQSDEANPSAPSIPLAFSFGLHLIATEGVLINAIPSLFPGLLVILSASVSSSWNLWFTWSPIWFLPPKHRVQYYYKQ